MTTYRIKTLTATGASELFRVTDAPDSDMAVMFLQRLCRGNIKDIVSITPIDDDTIYLWAEQLEPYKQEKAA